MQNAFPGDLGPPSVEQRHRFYEDEFGINDIKALQYRWKKPVLAFDIGSETTLYKARFKKYKDKIVYIREYEDFDSLLKRIVRYAPEDLYYDTRIYEHDPRQSNTVWEKPSGKELVFDLDPELVECRKCARRRERKETRLHSFIFCEECFATTAAQTLELWSFLERNFDDVRAVFSGRGFHLHVRDSEGFYMDDYDRQQLASRLGERFPIDQKITAGEKNLLRLPGSLHGLTGRKVVPVSKDDLEAPLTVLYEKSTPSSLDEEERADAGFI